MITSNYIKWGTVDPIRLTLLSFILCCVTFFVVSMPLISNNLPYLDDFYLIKEQEINGFWGPTNYFQSIWGYYRIVYTSLMSFVFSASEHIWALRLIGMALHFFTASMLYIVVKSLLQSRSAALVAFAMFLFFPYAYEAIAWPSNVGQYPLAPFLALSGACVVVCYGTQKMAPAIMGAVLMGFSFWIHEQAGPIVVALAIALVFKIHRSYRRLFGLAVATPVLSNFLLIYLTRDQNLRLSGEYAAKVDYVWTNIGYLRELVRTTPLGDLYYAPAGITLTWASALIAAAAIASGLVVFIAHKNRPVTVQQRSSHSILYVIFFFALMTGSYLVSLAPILLSPIPWHTARVVYIPFLALTLAFAAAVELLRRFTPSVLITAYVFIVSLLITAIIGWQAHALGSEAIAFDYQIRLNVFRSREAVGLVDRERDLTDTSLVVVRGFPGSDNGRPQFGEHMIGMSPGQFRANLGMRVYNGTPTPRFSFASGWDGLCVHESGYIELQRSTLMGVFEWEKIDPKNITYFVFTNGSFSVSRGQGPRFDSAIYPVLPQCPTAQT